MTRGFFLERGWYLALWFVWPLAVLVLARLFLVNPQIRAHREDTGRIVRAVQLQGKGESCR